MAASIMKGKKICPKNRKTKTVLEFDEKSRQEYLRGFHKRKNERRKLAREKHDKRILEERKSLLKQSRDFHSKNKAGLLQVPEIEQLVKPEVFDLPEHTVTISNISEVDFVGKSGLRLGQNTGFLNDDVTGSEETEKQPVAKKSIRQQLAQCSNQLSSQKQKVKKMKKKQMLRQKLQSKKKGKKSGKGKKRK